MPQEELLKICDARGTAIGMAERSFAHRVGLMHQVIHCHILQRDEEGWWIYYQQRAFSKRDFPGYYDIAVAGHVDPKERPEEAACREIREEAGLTILPGELTFLGTAREEIRMGEFFDREIGFVYALKAQRPAFQIGEEVERMVKFRVGEFLAFFEEEGEKIQAHPENGGDAFAIGREELCRHDLRLIRRYLHQLG